MTDLVFKSNDGVAVTTSLKVAETFGKSHDNVLRDIRKALSGGVLKNEETPMFEESTYINEQNGQEYPMFIMNRDGFTLLAMGFTGKKAMQFKIEYIAAFNAMEKALKEQSKPKSQLEILVESAQALLEQSRRLDKIESRLDTMEQEREESTKMLFAVSVSQNELPAQTLRDKVRELVNRYSSAMNIHQSDVWHKIYKQLFYLFHISINNYKKLHKKESNLDVAERNNFLDKIYDIASNLVREAKIA